MAGVVWATLVAANGAAVLTFFTFDDFLAVVFVLAIRVVEAPFTFAVAFLVAVFTTLALASTTGVSMILSAPGVGVTVQCHVPSLASSAQA